MDSMVRELEEQFLTAAWRHAHQSLAPGQPGAEVVALLEVCDEALARLAGLRLHLISQTRFIDGNVAVADALTRSTRANPRQVRAAKRLADDLCDRYQLVAAALQDGTISQAQAEAITCGLNKIPVVLTRAERHSAQTTILEHAHELGPAELRVLAARMLELLRPEEAEQAEAERLAREERHAKAGRYLRMRPDHHGSITITGQLPVADAALLTAQLDALMPPLASYRGNAELPGPDVRRADALIALCQHAAHAGTLPAHGLDRPQVRVTIPLTTLLDGLGASARLDTGELVSAGEARRLACDADLIPIVLGAHSQPLDVGKSHRFLTTAQRDALVERDRGCTFPSCEALPPACEGHHIIGWAHGGETGIGNATLLCPHHHRLVEPVPGQSVESQWQVHLDPDTHRPWYTPPRHVDPARKPRQHRRFLLDQITLTTQPPPEEPPLPKPEDHPWPLETSPAWRYTG